MSLTTLRLAFLLGRSAPVLPLGFAALLAVLPVAHVTKRVTPLVDLRNVWQLFNPADPKRFREKSQKSNARPSPQGTALSFPCRVVVFGIGLSEIVCVLAAEVLVEELADALGDLGVAEAAVAGALQPG